MISLCKICPIGYEDGLILHHDGGNNVDVPTALKLLSYQTSQWQSWRITDCYDHFHNSNNNSNNKKGSITSEDAVSIRFASQEEIWKMTYPYVERFNCNTDNNNRLTMILAGGSTSGKSYTLFGGSWYHERGIVPRYLASLFNHNIVITTPVVKGRLYQPRTQVQFNMYLIMKEDIVDLLDPPHVYKASVENVFLSKALGPMLLPLKTIIATNVDILLYEVSTAITTASVILANSNELLASAHLVLSLKVFSPSLDTVQYVDFIELASSYFRADNSTIANMEDFNSSSNNNNSSSSSTSITSQVDNKTVNSRSSSRSNNYSYDNFIGQSYSSWSSRTLYEELCDAHYRYEEEEGRQEELRKIRLNAMKDDDDEDEEDVDNGGAADTTNADAIASAGGTGGDDDKSNELNDSIKLYEALEMDHTKCILLYILSHAFNKASTCIAISCLRSSNNCFQENHACLNLIDSIRLYIDRVSSTQPVDPAVFIPTRNVHQIIQNCEEEMNIMNDDIDLQYELIRILNEKIITSKSKVTMLSMIKKKKVMKELEKNKRKISKSVKKIELLSQRIKSLQAFISGTIQMHEFNQFKEDEMTPKVQAPKVLKVDTIATTSSLAKSLIEQLTMDTATPLDDNYDKQVEDDISYSNPCPQDFLKDYAITDRFDTRNYPKVDDDDGGRSSTIDFKIFPNMQSEMELTEAQLEATKISIPTVAWQEEDPLSLSFKSKQPYLLLLSPYNMSSSYVKIPIHKGYTILKRTKVKVTKLAALPTIPIDLKRFEDDPDDDDDDDHDHNDDDDGDKGDDGEHKVSSHVVVKKKAMKTSMKPLDLSNIITDDSTDDHEKKKVRVDITNSMRDITIKKEGIYYQDQMNYLIMNRLVPYELVHPPDIEDDDNNKKKKTTTTTTTTTMRAQVHKLDTRPSTSKSSNSTRPTTADDVEMEVITDILFNIDHSHADDATILDTLIIMGIIFRSFDSMKLIPTRYFVIKKSLGKVKPIRPIFKLNGKSVIEYDITNNISDKVIKEGIELYDQDVIQIGSTRWIQICIPESNPAYKVRCSSHNNNDNDNNDNNNNNDNEKLKALIQNSKWEYALFQSYFHELHNIIIPQCLRKRIQIAHLQVNREMNAIAKTKDRTNLMKIDNTFEPTDDDINLFLSYIPIYDQYKIIETIACTTYATQLSFETRRNIIFSCVLRPDPSWNEYESTENEFFCLHKIQRIWKTYRESLFIICHESFDKATLDSNNTHHHHHGVSVPSSFDVELQAFSNINCISWIWNIDIFRHRLLFMIDMMSDFTDERFGQRDLTLLAAKYPDERDSFRPETLSDELVGNSYLCINRFEFLLDYNDSIRLIGLNGHPLGYIKLSVRCWIDEVLPIPSYITANVIPSLKQFIDHKLIINIHFEYISGLPLNQCADSFISFKFLGHLSIYRTPRCIGCNTSPFIDSTIQIIKPINHNLIEYIKTGILEFKVFACRKPSAKHIPVVIRDPMGMSLYNKLIDKRRKRRRKGLNSNKNGLNGGGGDDDAVDDDYDDDSDEEDEPEDDSNEENSRKADGTLQAAGRYITTLHHVMS